MKSFLTIIAANSLWLFAAAAAPPFIIGDYHPQDPPLPPGAEIIHIEVTFPEPIGSSCR